MMTVDWEKNNNIYLHTEQCVLIMLMHTFSLLEQAGTSGGDVVIFWIPSSKVRVKTDYLDTERKKGCYLANVY